MVRVEVDQLKQFAREGLESIGVPPEQAGRIGNSLVLANLSGHHSHGVRRIPQYAIMAEEGRIDPRATPSIERESENTATIDGEFAFGQLGGRKATEVVVEKAREQAMATVGIRDATHMGRIGEWAERTTDAGLLFLAFVNGQSDGSTAPPGSTEGRMFTNPIAFGLPTFDALDFSIVLDFATSQVANGKVKERRTAGTEIPEGWAITRDGEPQTDPEALLNGEGALLPLGGLVSGYKGFGLAVIAELFAATISDGIVAGQTDSSYSNAGAFIAIDPTTFTTKSQIEERVRAIEAHVKSASPHDDLHPGYGARGESALLPGEPEHQSRVEQRREGIEIEEQDYQLLSEFADEADIAVPKRVNI